MLLLVHGSGHKREESYTVGSLTATRHGLGLTFISREEEVMSVQQMTQPGSQGIDVGRGISSQMFPQGLSCTI